MRLAFALLNALELSYVPSARTMSWFEPWRAEINPAEVETATAPPGTV